MKTRTLISILALLLLGCVAPRLTQAQTSGESARGTYQFSLEDGTLKYVEFDAVNQGSTVGSMFYSDEDTIVYTDVDGTGDPENKYAGATLKINFDGLTVDKNQAVMSGTVEDSNVREEIGKRVLLTVEDNGDNTRVPDRLTWGFYKPVVRTWTPSDAEWKDDPGVGMRWLATDAERRDDPGIVMPRSETIDNKSFPISSYNFADIAKGSGDITVQP
jgi:hypothetical protein